MKRTVSALLCGVIALGASAQQPQQSNESPNMAADSMAILLPVELKEVVVEAARVINAPDRMILFPTSLQKKTATNGLGLLGKLQLNGIQVNTIFNTVKVSGGGEPLFCINGREVQLQDVLAIKPNQVVKVEYNDNPGARYKDAAVVINYITKAGIEGGSVMTDLMEAFNSIYGVNSLVGKYNYKNSEWSANYLIQHASFKEFFNENRETYQLEDGSSVTQWEAGYPSKLRYSHQYLTLNYNYQLPDKWMMNVALRGQYHNAPRQDLNSVLTNSATPDESATLLNHSKQHYNTTALDLYFQRSLPNQQTLIFDLVGTYQHTDNNQDYRIEQNETLLTDIQNDVLGKKYSLIGEALYEKAWGGFKWSNGIKHSMGYTHNQYSGTVNSVTELHQSNTYAYTELQQRTEKWNVAGGLGLNYLWFSQNNEGFDKLSLRPVLRLAYTPNSQLLLRYRGTAESKAPALDELSDIEQHIDNYQIRKGNPNLTPSTEFKNQLTLDYHPGHFNYMLIGNYTYTHNPIMEQTERTGNRFVRTYANQTSWQKLNTELNVKGYWLHGMLSLQAAVGVDYFDSKAPMYHHNHTNFYAELKAEAAYKFIALTVSARTHRPTLFGETLYYGEDLHDIALTYFKNRFTVSLCMNNPFLNNYRVGSENRNKDANFRDYQYVNETSRLALVKVTYNFNFGRKHESGKQRIVNQDTDSGVVKGK